MSVVLPEQNISNDKIISVRVESDIAIPSTNEHKLPTRRGNKVWLYKNPEVHKFQYHIESKLYEAGLAVQFKDLKVDYISEVKFGFHIKSNYNRRDTSNMIKLIEDALVTVIGVDDSKYKRIIAEKFHTNNEKESIEITITI